MLTFIAIVALMITVGILANLKLQLLKWDLKDELSKEIATNLKAELGSVAVKANAKK